MIYVLQTLQELTDADAIETKLLGQCMISDDVRVNNELAEPEVTWKQTFRRRWKARLDRPEDGPRLLLLVFHSKEPTLHYELSIFNVKEVKLYWFDSNM